MTFPVAIAILISLYIFTIWKSIVYNLFCRDGIYFDKNWICRNSTLKKMFLFSCCPFFIAHHISSNSSLFELWFDLWLKQNIESVYKNVQTILQKYKKMYNKTIKYFIGFSNTWITHRVEDLPATVEMKNSNKIAVPYVPVFHLILSHVHLPHIPYFSINSFIQRYSLHELTWSKQNDLKVILIQTVSFHPI